MSRLSSRRASHAVKADSELLHQTWVDTACSPSAHKLVTFVTAVVLCLYLTSPPKHTPYSKTPAPAAPPLHTDSSSPGPFSPPPITDPSLPRTVPGPIEGLIGYIDTRWKNAPAGDGQTGQDGSPPGPHVWLTVGNGSTVEGPTAGQALFFDRLNAETVATNGLRTRQSALVVLCADDDCLAGCEERGLWCYGGSRLAGQKPTKVSQLWCQLRIGTDVIKMWMPSVEGLTGWFRLVQMGSVARFATRQSRPTVAKRPG